MLIYIFELNCIFYDDPLKNAITHQISNLCNFSNTIIIYTYHRVTYQD